MAPNFCSYHHHMYYFIASACHPYWRLLCKEHHRGINPDYFLEQFSDNIEWRNKMFYQRRATYEMLSLDEPSSSGTTQQQQVSGDSPRRKHSRHAEARRHPKRRDSQTRDDSPSHMGAIYQPQDEGPTGTPPGETSSRRVLIDPNTTVYDDDENDEDNTYANTAGLETEYGEELDELEQYELDDRLGEMMPIAFGRRHRRVRCFMFD